MTQFNLDLINKWPTFGWPLSSTSIAALSVYAVGGFDPKLALDFIGNTYRTGGTDSTLSSSVTHTATSNATMTDSDGNIKWRPHNLLSYSEDFSNSGWSKINSSVSANATTAPDGTTTADKIIADTSFLQHRLDQTPTSVAGDQTFSVYVKDAGYGFAWLRIGSAGARFSIADGITTSVTGGVTASSQDVGNGWRLLSISYSASANDIARINVLAAQNGSDFVGDGTSGIYVWGAHLYRSDLGGMVDNPAQSTGLETYVPTTTSAVYLPRVGHHIYNGSAWVNEGVLHESEARTNLLGYSNDFTNSLWSKQAITLTGSGVSPSGLTDATVITASANIAQHRVYQNLATISSYSKSVYAKAGTANFISVNGGNVAVGYAVFNLSTGVVSSQANIVQATMEDVGNGWYRCSIHGTVATQWMIVNMGTTDANAVPQVNWLGAGETVQLYGMQLEAGSTPSSYIPTSGSTVTRAAETLTVPAANLPWPTPVETTGTELVTNGTFDSDLTGWATSSADWTWDASARAHLNTTSNYQTISYDTGYATGGMQAGVSYLIEFDYELVSGRFKLSLNSTNSYATTVTTLGSGRFSLQILRPADNRTDQIQIRNETATTELYIDNVSVKEINPLSVSIQMDGKITYADQDEFSAHQFMRWRANGSDNISIVGGTNTGDGLRVLFQQVAGGVNDTIPTGVVYNEGILVPFNLSSRHGSTFINGATDGTALTADTTPVALPDLSTTDLNLGYDFMGTIGKFRVWSDDLTDTGIATASAPSTEPSLQLTFDGSSTSSFTVLDWSE